MIEIKNISKAFDGNMVLNNFSLNINDKEKIALMGKSGVGKTTLINIMAGLLKQDSGVITGVPKDISMVFQENRLLNDFTAFDNIAIVCNAQKDIIKEHFRLLNLEDSMYKTIGELSGGMKRRVALIRAMLAKSEFIILDEPFKGLDEDTKKQTMDYTMECIKNKACLIITHDTGEAKALCVDRILQL